MYEWIIIGGGVQGMTMAAFLLQSKKTSEEKLKVIDPHSKPLENWRKCTEAISMPYLRSPSVHHIEMNPFGLERFSKQKGHHGFYGRFKRPSLELFKKHCEHIYRELNLEDCWVQGRTETLKKTGDHWEVTLSDGKTLATENVVLAIGIGEQPYWPEWAEAAKKEFDHIYHVFDKDLELDNLPGPVAVIGGGMTAAHLSNKLAGLYPGEVTMLKRHPFRVKLFDSDPGWLGPKNQRTFRMEADYASRRNYIKAARHRGSITRDLHVKLHHLKKRGMLEWKDFEVETAAADGKTLVLHGKDGSLIRAESVILATGFLPSLPGKEWINPLIERENLTCAGCGYPIVNEHLQWDRGLYVTGALAELQVGPIARNISGARQAAELILSGL